MSEQAALQNIPDDDFAMEDPLAGLKKEIDAIPQAAILCETKEKNPNYLAIIYANQPFYEIFGISYFNLIGKSYDFLFANLDLDYSSEDQMEYVRLIKAVKDFHPCSVIISLFDHKPEPSQVRFKITFTPSNVDSSDFVDHSTHHHAVFTFKKMESGEQKAEININGETVAPSSYPRASNVTLLKNLERTLRNERLLREVGSLIITDLPIREIAQKTAKILCEHLRVDRVLMHDYHEGMTNFVVEHHTDSSRPMFLSANDSEGLQTLTKYINFQNHFYQKFGSKSKRCSLSIIEDMIADPNFTPIHEVCSQFSIVSQIAITTTFNGKVNGGIYIHQSSKRSWLEDELELIEMIADQFSIAIDRSESIERVMVANHALMEKTAQLKDALKHEKELRQMQNEFVALVSHEFKTPLQIIDSTRELLMRKIKGHNLADEAIEKGFERIKHGIQRMNGLIHSTLNLARMESGERGIKLEVETFNLRKFIEEIIEKNSNLALNKNIKIITKLNELPEEFHGDPKLLDHSITNIISNAVKYSRNDTTVKILAKSNDSKVALRVIDQGIGIPKDDLGSIGQKFFRAKNTLSVAGTGIGIYLTKHFIELHGGDILIESELNVGTTVTVTLPRNL